LQETSACNEIRIPPLAPYMTSSMVDGAEVAKTPSDSTWDPVVAATEATRHVEAAAAAAKNSAERIAAAAQETADTGVVAAWKTAELLAITAQTSADQLSVIAQNSADQVLRKQQEVADAADEFAGATVDQFAATADAVESAASKMWDAMEAALSAPLFTDEFDGCLQEDRTGQASSSEHEMFTEDNNLLLPVRLCMTSSDCLCFRSMEVEWDQGAGERQLWSSHVEPICSWYEAEKVLPSNAVNIRVRFKTHAVTSSYVNKVDRRNDCQWVKAGYGLIPEEIWLRKDEAKRKAAIDLTFELRGTLSDCHVWRAWNVARGMQHPPEAWESWEEVSSRPQRKMKFKVLRAAAVVCSMPSTDQENNPLENLSIACKRLVAAAKALQEARRETLAKLQDIDEKLTGQWVAVNSGNTIGAGLAVASAALLIVAPPVGAAGAAGLGIGSAAACTASTAGDVVSDQVMMADLRHILADDDANTLIVAELQREWLQARDRAGSELKASGRDLEEMSLEELGQLGLHGVRVGLAVAHTIVTAAIGVPNAQLVAAEASLLGSRALPIAARFLSVAGAVVSVGAAAHGWATTKSLQGTVRKRLQDITRSMLMTERWLAGMNELECPICLSRIELSDDVRGCKGSWHYSHSACLEQWVAKCSSGSREAACPVCCGPLAPHTGILEMLIADDMCRAMDDMAAPK